MSLVSRAVTLSASHAGCCTGRKPWLQTQEAFMASVGTATLGLGQMPNHHQCGIRLRDILHGFVEDMLLDALDKT
eukprot:1641111-Amphidinium_carterae.1